MKTAVRNVAREKDIINPPSQMMRSATSGCPAGFYELMMHMQNKRRREGGPLFKYAYSGDILREFKLHHIYVRITKSIIECVILAEVSDFEIRTLAFILNHVVGNFLVNTPTEADHAKLKHIGDVTQTSTQKQVSQMILRHLDRQKMPMHFVLNSKWQIASSKLMHRVASDHTVKRLLQAHRQVDFAI